MSEAKQNPLYEVFTSREAAEKWELAENTVTQWCNRGKFHEDEARKSGKVWLVTKKGMKRLTGIGGKEMKVSLKNKVTIDVNAGNFYSANDCLKSLGYSRLDEKGKSYKGTHTLFEKDGKIYAFVSANHFNTYFYDITLAVVE